MGRFHHTREVKVGILLGLDNIEENVGKVNLLFGLERDDDVSKARIDAIDKSACVDMASAMDDEWRADGIRQTCKQQTSKRERMEEGKRQTNPLELQLGPLANVGIGVERGSDATSNGGGIHLGRLSDSLSHQYAGLNRRRRYWQGRGKDRNPKRGLRLSRGCVVEAKKNLGHNLLRSH